MKKVVLFLIPIILFLNFCSESKETIFYDFIAEFPDSEKLFQVENIQSLNTWSENYKINGWVKDGKSEKDALLIQKSRRKAVLRFGSIAKKDKKIDLMLKPLISQKLKNPPLLKIRLNGKLVYTSFFNWEDFRKISIRARKEQLYIGENFLEFQCSPSLRKIKDNYWLALKEIKIYEQGSFVNLYPQLSQDPFQVITKENLFQKKRAIKLALNTSLNYYLKIPKHSKLLFDLSMKTPNPDYLSGRKFLVYLETAPGETQVLFEKDFGKKFYKKKIPFEMNLHSYHDQISKISFVFLKDSLDRNFVGELYLWEPRIVTEKRQESAEQINETNLNLEKPFNILIYLIDCLRPDHLPFFDYKKNVAPHMDEFSNDSIIFKNAFAQASWTRPSVASLFTGLYPFIHMAITRESGLASGFHTLAEALEKAGYYTIGISSNAGIKEFFNFHQGFSFFKYHHKLSGGTSDTLNTYAFPQLKKKKTPFFLYLHTMDVHRPYIIKKEFYPSMTKEPPEKNSQVIQIIKGGVSYEVDLRRTFSLYDATILQNDKSFGDLMNELKKYNLYDNTLIILMSDHGEQFYEHGKSGHGGYIYQEVIHLLMVIKLPGQLMAGRKIYENIQEIDIFPTLLDLIGEPIPSYLLGKSLKNVLLSSSGFESPVHDEIFVETGPDLKLKAVIAGNWKLIHRTQKWSDDIKEYLLFNLENDPSERKNLFNRNPIATEYLKRRLKNWVQSQKLLARIGKEEVEKTLTKKEEEELRALGYIK